MVILTSDAFGQKCGKTIERLQHEDNFYLGHFEDANGDFTVFGNAYIVFTVPLRVGEETDKVRAESIAKLVREKCWSDDAQRNMKWVPLPKASELKPGRDKENPTKCNLAATDLEPGREITDECAAYPFAVQAGYLKLALQLAPFIGRKDTRSSYNPLCLWTQDDYGHEISCVIMPIRE